ncbi:helix-turn-helix transcriptional regulator [Clostridium sp. Marseille-P2415]|uniref:helix-turn-helix transcriptional regulator n=1 Tax=Clostridium sp. Marseille-P2415 TaxID=1805471 RepID=UPI0009887AA2|nr:AraC family transcriptional regulator [Clostridium sp. Marseille-P2415]
MIENLKGIHETVNYKEYTNIRLYDNTEAEDYPSHWHTPLEIIMPLTNTYSVLYNSHAFELKPGEIILICPGVIHSLKAPKAGRRIIFQAELPMFHEMKELESILFLLNPTFIITPETFPAIHDKLYHCMLEIMEEYKKDLPLTETKIYSMLLEMFALIGRNHTENVHLLDAANIRQKKYTEKFIFICNYISSHCTEELTLEEVASLAGFSKYHFTRLFKQFTNVSFYKYVNKKRIAIAETLLINPQLSITEVALRSGFSSQSAFIRMFKIIKSCTPTEFRQMYTQS